MNDRERDPDAAPGPEGREAREDGGDPEFGPSAASPGPDAVAVTGDEVEDDELALDVAGFAEPFDEIGDADLDGFLRRTSGTKVVLLGASSHGTSEFHRTRSRLTRELITVFDFDFVALEAGWEDAARIDRYVRDGDVPESEWTSNARFPAWVWRNAEMREFVESLRDYNGGIGEPGERVAVYGLDLYGMSASIERVLAHLGRVDAEAAREARTRYACLAPWRELPSMYSSEATRETMEACEKEVVKELRDLLDRRLRPGGHVSDDLVEAVQNARVVADAERYYRRLYRAADEAWNLREKHMAETVRLLLAHHGPDARGVVWAHNAHVGDASATSLGTKGRESLGELCREAFGREAYLVGLLTDRGTVAAASRWGGPVQIEQLEPSRGDAWEHFLTLTGVERALFPIWQRAPASTREHLADPRPERTLGVVHRPQGERENPYILASLSRQFDEVVWIEETEAITPLATRETEGEPGTYPSGL